METLFLVRDPSKQGLTNAVQRAGYYTVCAPDADTALNLLGALRANLFIIDVATQPSSANAHSNGCARCATTATRP